VNAKRSQHLEEHSAPQEATTTTRQTQLKVARNYKRHQAKKITIKRSDHSTKTTTEKPKYPLTGKRMKPRKPTTTKTTEVTTCLPDSKPHGQKDTTKQTWSPM
jgi:hypothetical protein